MAGSDTVRFHASRYYLQPPLPKSSSLSNPFSTTTLMQSPTFQNLINQPFEENSHCETLTAQANYLASRSALANAQNSSATDCPISDNELTYIDSLLENMASFVPQKAPAPFVAAFVRLIVLHVTENKLFHNVSRRLAGEVPEWWSQLGESGGGHSAGAVFGIWLRCGRKCSLSFAENAAFVAAFAKCFPQILQALRVETKKTQTGNDDLASRLQSVSLASKYSPTSQPGEAEPIDTVALEAFVLDEDTSELACLCILQSSKATGHILAAAQKYSTEPVAVRAQRILEVLAIKMPLVHLAQCGLAPGAALVISKFYKQLASAISTALTMPTFFIGEALCHGVGFDLLKYPTLLNGLEIAVTKLEALAHLQLLDLYRLQNTKARNTSFLATVCDVIHLVSVNMMLPLGDGLSHAGPFKTIFAYAQLPPMAKSNYYLADRDVFEIGNELLKSQVLLTALASSLGCLFRILPPLIQQEVFVEESSLMLTEEAKRKILVQRLEKVFASTTAAMAALKLSEDWPLAKCLKKDCIEVLKVLLKCCQKQSPEIESDFFWITLFNLANDICYSDISFAPVLLDTFDLFLEGLELDQCNELVLSALVQFYSTFDLGGQTYPTVDAMTEWDKSGQELVTVPRSEYEFLINEKEAPKSASAMSKKASESAKKNDAIADARSRQGSNGCKKSAIVSDAK